MTHSTRGLGQRTAAQRGFTLVEMLVTLTLMSMIAVVLWQAMQQVARVERLLQRSGASSQLDLVRREWVRSLIRAALEEQVGAPRQFVGDAQNLRLVSSESVALPGLAGRPVQLKIEADARSGRQRLLLVPTPDDEPRTDEPVPVELLSWQGAEARFRYLSPSGTWSDVWPVPSTAAELSAAASDTDVRRAALLGMPRLPRAVWIYLGADAGGPMVTEISATSPGRGRLAQWESQ
ncbi:MAG: prepilin-type N-terminal cleavage/methylation domain-containing protein [Burkholderiales bacterium]|nr:MAG: prepilin-type N-terminal cleavage/methylation domain-containing protein [Burkholderiales bacterium]